MLVALYVGGKLQNGEDGVQYTKDAAFGFEINENTTFQELKQLIYEKTAVNPNRYEIELATRIDNSRGVGGRPYFVKFPITDATLWSVVYTQFAASGVPIIEIYSKRVPRTGAGPSSAAGAGPSGYDNQGYQQHSSYDNQGYHQHSPYDNQGYHSHSPYDNQEYHHHSPYDNQDYHHHSPYDNESYHNSSENTEELPPPPRQTPIIPRFPTMPESGPVPVNRTDIDVDVDAIDAIPEREMETGDEYQGVWESDDLSDGDANVPGLSRAEKFPIRGRGNKHPVATFNDTTAFEEADISYFGPRVQYNQELAAGQVYTNIDELTKKINETHVHGNWECQIQKKDRTRLVVLCKTHPRCEFRLYATPAGGGKHG